MSGVNVEADDSTASHDYRDKQTDILSMEMDIVVKCILNTYLSTLFQYAYIDTFEKYLKIILNTFFSYYRTSMVK